MSTNIIIKVTMELLSDAILGSGQSVPGGESIGVLKDKEGYPYFKGETFKGLLRESLQNYLVWSGKPEKELDKILNEIMGESGWNGNENYRHIHITPLTLEEAKKPMDHDECYSYRTFTSLENGVIKEGTLRMAAVVNRGLEFTGEIECQSYDEELLLKALSGIKHIGTMRNRGFGNVKFSWEISREEKRTNASVNNAKCIYLRLKTVSPLIITDLQRSNGNNLDVCEYISGSAIRGAVVSALAKSDPKWFNLDKVELLSEKTRFLDLIPVCGGRVGIPSIKGFHEDKKDEKAEGKAFENIVVKGGIDPKKALKKAHMGSFCAIDGKTVEYWSAVKTGSTRIYRNTAEKEMFQTASLAEGQEFEGYIYTDNACFAEKIAEALKGTVWIGADRHAGYGKCSVEELKAVDEPAWIEKYGYRDGKEIGNELYMMAISPFSMTDEYGDLCGINENLLAEKLGVKVSIDTADTSVIELSTYNSTWGCRDAAVTMYDRGSLFKLKCDKAPCFEKIKKIQKKGLGIRTAEGFGQVLFLRPSLLEKIEKKREIKPDKSQKTTEVMKLRRARYNWIMENVKNLGVGSDKYKQISKSHLGEIQDCCEKGIALGGDFKPVEEYLYHNLYERGSTHGERFETINGFIKGFFEEDLSETLRVTTNMEKLRLLCELIDFSRKGAE